MQLEDGTFSVSWDGDPDGRSLADLVFDSQHYSTPTMQNMILSALALLKNNGVAIKDKRLLAMNPQPTQLLGLPVELLRNIANHIVYEDNYPIRSWYHEEALVAARCGLLPLFYRPSYGTIEYWTDLLEPLFACKALYEAGQDQLCYANAGTAEIRVYTEYQLDAYAPSRFIASDYRQFSPGIASRRRRLEITLHFGQLGRCELGYHPGTAINVPHHQFCADTTLQTLRRLPGLHPHLKSLRVALEVHQQDGTGFALSERAHDGEATAVTEVLRNLGRLVDTMQMLDFDVNEMRLAGKVGDHHNNYFRISTALGFHNSFRLNAKEGPWLWDCECTDLGEREFCTRCVVTEWVYMCKSDATLCFSRPCARATNNTRGRIVDDEQGTEMAEMKIDHASVADAGRPPADDTTAGTLQLLGLQEFGWEEPDWDDFDWQDTAGDEDQWEEAAEGGPDEESLADNETTK